MRVVRKGVFETNSSSTHSLTICTKEEYEQWERGEVLLDILDDEFIKRKDVIESLKKDECFNDEGIDWNDDDVVDDVLADGEFNTIERYYDNDILEGYCYDYTTKSGDEIVIFGRYGYSG